MVCVCGHYGVAAHGVELGACRGHSTIENGIRIFYACIKNCKKFKK